MKILLIASTFREKEDKILDFLLVYASNLQKLGNKVTLLASHGKGLKKIDEFNGVKLKRFSYFKPESWQSITYGKGMPENIKKSLKAKLQLPFYYFSGIKAVKKELKEFQPDVVQALWVLPNGLIARKAIEAVGKQKDFKKPKLIVTAFGADVYLAKKMKLKKLLNSSLKTATAITAISTATKQALVETGVKKEIKVMPIGGVDLEKFNPKVKTEKIIEKHKLKGKNVLLIVGRIVERKGHAYLIKAMPEILKKNPNTILLITSYGPEKEKLEKLSKELNLEKNVLFVGTPSFEELPAYYNACTVFCLPAIIDSRGDTEGGQSMVIAEAMACKKPVVGGNVGGIPDLVIHNKTGLLVEQKDVQALTQAINKLFENKKLREKLATEGYKKILKEFSWEAIAKNHVKLFLQKQ
ncbi:MAG: glycosyltransferase family 4 protein [archaeon]